MAGRRHIRGKDKGAHRVAVDPTKLNMGNTYSSAPVYYYDLEFTCKDCGSVELWTAEQQKWWYEEVGGYFFATAVRCRPCRQKERDRKAEARRVHLEGVHRKTHQNL